MASQLIIDTNPLPKGVRTAGFTIVELLIVVVVIAILAAITIVSYNGIQGRALEVTLQSDLRNSATALELDYTKNGSYPATLEAANDGKGVKSSDSTNLQYSYNSTNNTYCLSATSAKSGVKTFYLSSQAGQVVQGLCAGHAPDGATAAGLAWTNRPIGSYAWASVAYGNGVFMTISDRGTDQTSVYSASSNNGQTWSSGVAIGSTPMWVPSIMHDGSKFVAGFATGRGKSATTANNGSTWSFLGPDASISSYVINGIAYGDGKYVGIRNTPPTTNSFLWRSTDGVNWGSSVDIGIPHAGWSSVIYAGGQFVAVASSGTGTNRVMTSPDGITWTMRSAAEANTWMSVTYGKGLYVAVAQSGTKRVMTSPDGITWTGQDAAQANSWKSVAYGNGRFVAVSSDGTNRVMTSVDGKNWTSVAASDNASPWQSVTFGGTCFVAVANNGTTRAMTSCE